MDQTYRRGRYSGGRGGSGSVWRNGGVSAGLTRLLLRYRAEQSYSGARGERGGGDGDGRETRREGRQGVSGSEGREPLASAIASTVIPPRAGKRKRHTETRIDCQRRLTRRRGDTTISHSVLHTNTAHDRHTINTQPLQYTDCTTGQAHCTVVGMEIIQSNQI